MESRLPILNMCEAKTEVVSINTPKFDSLPVQVHVIVAFNVTDLPYFWHPPVLPSDRAERMMVQASHAMLPYEAMSLLPITKSLLLDNIT
jgi:hypothetical protein